MTSTELPRRRGKSKGDQREQQILVAARRLMSSQPFSAVTIDELAAEAGLSRTGFYFYFPTKNAVLAALIAQVWEEIVEIRVWFDATGPAPELLAKQMAQTVDIIERNRRILACASADDYPPVREFLAAIRARFIDRVTEKIESDRAQSLAPAGPPARDLAQLAYAMRDGYLAQPVPPTRSQTQTVEYLTDATLRLIYRS